METGKRTEGHGAGAAPSHILERARLIELIEESGARIVVLHAPAGYGKTTLARQWSQRQPRPPLWYRCTSASADVAVLAAGVAHTLSSVAPDAGKEIAKSLRASSDPAGDVEAFVELLVPALADWPADAWLVVDDYHFATTSDAAEAFMEGLALDSHVQLLIVSRVRPAWASTRRVLYGEVLDLDHHALAFTQEESELVLGAHASPFCEQARGWPAIVGLAARLDRLSPPPSGLPEELFDFLAEELYQGSATQVQDASLRLAVCPTLDRRSIELVLETDDWADVLGPCVAVDFVQRERDGGYEMHPLLRTFLVEKIHRSAGEELEVELPRRLGRDLLEQHRWAEVFSLHVRFPRAGLFLDLLQASVDDLIETGRLETIERWLEHASSEGVRHPLVDLTTAKLALRRGEHARAEVLATAAADAFDPAHPALPNALITAGQAAMLGDKAPVARALFASARATATMPDDRREALLGDFFAALELEDRDAPDLLAELEAAGHPDARTKLRLASANLMLSALGDVNIEAALDEALPSVHLLERVDDAYSETSLLIGLASMSNLAARYRESLAFAQQVLDLARDLGASFVVPHAQTHLATAEMGLRRFSRAARLLREVEESARVLGDGFLEGNARAFRARLLLMRGRPAEALRLLPAETRGFHHPGLLAEHRTTRALILATQGELAEALEEAEALPSRRAEARTFRAWSRAIVHLQDRSLVHETPRDAFALASRLGAFDTFVCAYRAYPQLLTDLAVDASFRPTLTAVLERANDAALATRVGLTVTDPAGDGVLSQREREVLRLLHEGLSNREIAQSLYISLATVKVHLHHIYGKLGVRTRAQATARTLDV
jgi:LuxR family maltose regulon positive regulatory protein